MPITQFVIDESNCVRPDQSQTSAGVSYELELDRNSAKTCTESPISDELYDARFTSIASTTAYDLQLGSGVVEALAELPGYDLDSSKTLLQAQTLQLWTRSTTPWSIACEHNHPRAEVLSLLKQAQLNEQLGDVAAKNSTIVIFLALFQCVFLIG